jgi:hypothetical protein
MESVRHLCLADGSSTRPGVVLRTVNKVILGETPIYKTDAQIKAFFIPEEDVPNEDDLTASERVLHVMSKSKKPQMSTFTERIKRTLILNLL